MTPNLSGRIIITVPRVCVLGGQCFEAQLTLFRQLSLAEYLAHSSSSSRHGDLKAARLLKWGVGL